MAVPIFAWRLGSGVTQLHIMLLKYRQCLLTENVVNEEHLISRVSLCSAQWCTIIMDRETECSYRFKNSSPFSFSVIPDSLPCHSRRRVNYHWRPITCLKMKTWVWRKYFCKYSHLFWSGYGVISSTHIHGASLCITSPALSLQKLEWMWRTFCS